MSTPPDPALKPLVDPVALRAFLAGTLPGPDLPLQVERVRGGHSNETFFIDRGNARYVLRRPPRGPLLPTAHDVGREFRLLHSLSATAVPVPRPILHCEDPAIIGAPFYLMERIAGIIIRDRLPPPYDGDLAARRALGECLIEILAVLHAVDWRAVGLESFGKPEGYLARQLRRWSGQLQASRTRDLPDLDHVTAWLLAHLPASPPATIVHGDYRLDNVMLAPTLPTRVLAILDWEMATLGDPLADLGYLIAWWREPGDTEPAVGDVAWHISGQPGFLTRHELVERYVAATGRNVTNLAYYIVLAIWKMAIVLEGSYKRHLAGTTDDPFFATLGDGIPALAHRARTITERGQG